ncbi:cation efflux family protein [Artemisia annua]|uniref:Cation efflux family protein n=1 Tax=Artemisia annua TaxID=35608 RepID=A0A2U1NZ88_ARTAN|nr:cation efflux family protein [Artemisia annua]
MVAHSAQLCVCFKPSTFIHPQMELWGTAISRDRDGARTFQPGHSHINHHDETSKEGERIFRLGLAADIGLTVGKAVTGYLSGSTAIIADAAHSLSDVLSGVALVSFRASRVPKDKEHPYGHGKFETLGALGISGVLLVSAGGIAWHALDVLVGVLSATSEITNQSLLHQHAQSHNHQLGIDMNHPILALNTTIIAIAVKEGLYWMTKRAGERVGSGLMKANAWHHRADAISSLVALIGVGGSILGVSFLDPLAGLVVSGMIFKAGAQTGYQSILELVDAAIPSRDLDPFRKTVVQVDGVKASYFPHYLYVTVNNKLNGKMAVNGCRHLRGRRAGSTLYLDVKILVDPFCSISTAHQIGENVRHQIQKSHPEVSEVFIQLEPTKQKVTELTYDSNNLESEHHGIERIITDMLITKFSEKMVVKHITKRMMQDKVLLEVEVSMPPDSLISDAMEVAEEAKSHILQATNNSIEAHHGLEATGSEYHRGSL